MANFGDEARRIARGEKRSWDYDMMIEEINCGARNENPGRRFAIESLLALASDGRGGGGGDFLEEIMQISSPPPSSLGSAMKGGFRGGDVPQELPPLI